MESDDILTSLRLSDAENFQGEKSLKLIHVETHPGSISEVRENDRKESYWMDR